MSNEVWFRRKEGLVVIGVPVHWKGWIVSLVWSAVFLSALAAVLIVAPTLEPESRRLMQFAGGGVGLVATVIYLVITWPHRG